MMSTPEDRPAARWRATGPHAAVLAFYAAATAALTWPAVAHLGDAGYGAKAAHHLYQFSVLLHQPLWAWPAPTFTGTAFPAGESGIAVALPQYLLGAVLAPVVGTVAAFDITGLVHLALGAYGGFRLSRCVWGDTLSGPGLDRDAPAALLPHLAAGLAMGLSAFALAVYAIGQPESLGLFYMCLAAELGWRLGTGAPRGRRWIALVPGLAAALALAFLSSPYLVMGLLLCAWPAALAGLRHPASRGGTALALVTTAAVCAPLALHYARTLPGGDSQLHPEDIAEQVVAGHTLPARALWTREGLRGPADEPNLLVLDPALALRPRQQAREQTRHAIVYLGLVAVAVGLVGLASRRRRGRRLLLAMALPATLGLGLYLTVNGWTVTVGGNVLGLPLLLLRDVPLLGDVLRTIQVPGRLVVGVLLPGGLAVAAGVAAVARRSVPAAAGLALLLVLDQAVLGPVRPPLALMSFVPCQAHQVLAGLDDGLAVVDIPPLGFVPDAGRGQRPPVRFVRGLVAGAAHHGHPVPYTLTTDPILPPAVEDGPLSRAVAGVLAGDAGAAAELTAGARALRELGYGYVVLHRGTGLLDATAEERLSEALRASTTLVAGGDDGSELYRLAP